MLRELGEEWPPRRLPLLLLLLLPLLRVLLLLLLLLPLLQVLLLLLQNSLENDDGDGASSRVEPWISLSCNPEELFASGSAAGKNSARRGKQQKLSPVLRAEPRAASSRSTKCHSGTSCHTSPTQERVWPFLGKEVGGGRFGTFFPWGGRRGGLWRHNGGNILG